MLPNIQRCLVPRRPSSRYGAVEIAHSWDPLDDISGDFLYYEKGSNGYLSLEIGDVTGHGTYAGLVMTALHGLIFGLRQNLTPPDQVLANANTFLCRLQELETSRDPHAAVRMMMCSMFSLRIDFGARVMTYCNAGHPPPLYLPVGVEGQILRLGSRNLILGVKATAIYRAYTLRPSPGDTLLLFTDGVSEAMNETDEEFSVGKLEALLHEHSHLKPREIIARISREVAQFRGAAEPTDDVAMAVLQFGPYW